MNTLRQSPWLKYLTPLSGVCLVLGVGFGLLANKGLLSADMFAWLDLVTAIWIAILKLTALPLMLAYVATALISGGERSSGKIGGMAFVGHLGLIIVAAALTLTAVPLVTSNLDLDAFDLSSLTESAESADSTTGTGAAGTGATLESSIIDFVTRNPVILLIDRQILALLLIVAILSALIGRNARARNRVLPVVVAITNLARRGIMGLIVIMPVIVFALAFEFTATAGLRFAGLIAVYFVLTAGLLTAVLGVLVLAGWLIRGIPFRDLMRGLSPIVLMAVASRSSLACLPISSEVARDRFKLSEPVIDVVIPLSVAAFKLNKVVTTPTKMMVLALAFGITVTPVELAFFVLMAVVTSFGTPGVPSGSAFRMLPFYVALGIPVEGYLLTEVVDGPLDLFKTSVNAVEDVTLAAMVDKWVAA